MAYIFSSKKEDEALHQVEGSEELRLCMRANKFKMLYGLLVALNGKKMLKER